LVIEKLKTFKKSILLEDITNKNPKDILEMKVKTNYEKVYRTCLTTLLTRLDEDISNVLLFYYS
jgi:hypothetical protein